MTIKSFMRVTMRSLPTDHVQMIIEEEYGHAKITMTPEQANRLAYRLMSYAAGGGNVETVIWQGSPE